MIGFVAIGRNEGERLRRCLESIMRLKPTAAVYVDSGSTDGSPEVARSLGVEVVSLDLSLPFTMARARNSGWRQLLQNHPEIAFLHFVDGDCEILPGWLDKARTFLDQTPGAAAVCGRRKERFPERSVFNRLCDTEWNTPVGEAKSCGGDALMRREALEQAGGFNESLIAGEEPELCLRMRRSGWTIHRLDADMTLHDANILRLSQWWKRCVRGGYGAADVAWRTSRNPALGEVLFASQVKSAVVWTLVLLGFLCAAVAAAMIFSLKVAVVVFAGFLVLAGLQMFRIAAGVRNRCKEESFALEYGFFTLAAKLPQGLGILLHRLDLWKNRQARLIEYKS